MGVPPAWLSGGGGSPRSGLRSRGEGRARRRREPGLTHRRDPWQTTGRRIARSGPSPVGHPTPTAKLRARRKVGAFETKAAPAGSPLSAPRALLGDVARSRRPVPPTLIPNGATRGRGGRDGGRAPGQGEHSSKVSAAPPEPECALSLRPINTSRPGSPNAATVTTDAGPVLPYVEREFRRYLDCGILARGFARARCGQETADAEHRLTRDPALPPAPTFEFDQRIAWFKTDQAQPADHGCHRRLARFARYRCRPGRGSHSAP